MDAEKRTPIRFSLLTALVWLLVASGIIFLLWQVINRISTNILPFSTPTSNQTLANQTIAAILTARPGDSATPVVMTNTPQPSAQPTISPVSTLPPVHTTVPQGVLTLTATPRVLCNQAAAGNPIDITIPDDTVIRPGQSFNKTWKLVNVGTCTWTSSYSISFFYGDRMNAAENIPLQGLVKPAQSMEISADMVAPNSPGSYQGNWKLADPDGKLFGIGPNGDSPFWVRIIVAESLTTTPSATASPSLTNTPTGAVTPSSTPEGQVGGVLLPAPGDTIDLDRLVLNSGETDIVYQVDAAHFHWLSPYQDAKIGVYGSQQPTLQDCRSASMSSAPIAVESLPIGTYLCYLTGEGRFGRMLLAALDPTTFSLTLDLLTWAPR